VHDGKHEYSPQRHASCGGGGQVTAINIGALLAKLAD
jgi:hypothetical protein